MDYPYNIKSDYGSFHPYSFFMMLGIMVTVLLSIWQLRRRGVRVNWVWMLIGMGVVVFVGLLGGSLLGKIHSSEPWYKKFEFWDPKGGMGIYGAVLFGLLAFLGYFVIFCRFNKVSFWAVADSTVPNILLAQAIGRWGNFFNHELLGGKAIPRSALNWLPKFIADNCRNDGNFGFNPVYHAPLFLYESIGTFLAWVLITFVVARLGEWIGPRHPDWSKLPRALHGQKRSWWQGLKFWTPNQQLGAEISPRQLWLRDYFHYQPTLKALDQTSRKQIHTLYNPHQFFVVRSGVATGLYFVLWNLVRICLTPFRSPSNFYTRIPGQNYDFSEDGIANLQQIGVELSFMVAILALGILLVVFLQLGLFTRYRRVGYMYEKPYLDLTHPQNWQLSRYYALFVQNGVGNKVRSLLRTIAAFASWSLGERINESDLKSYFKIIKINCYARRSEDLTLRALIVLKPTPLSISRWKFPAHSVVWKWDQRFNLRSFKLVLKKFFQRQGGLEQSIETIVNFAPYRTMMQRQIKLRFCHNSSNLLLFVAGLSFLGELPVTGQQLLITPQLLRQNPLFKLNSNLKIVIHPSA